MHFFLCNFEEYKRDRELFRLNHPDLAAKFDGIEAQLYEKFADIVKSYRRVFKDVWFEKTRFDYRFSYTFDDGKTYRIIQDTEENLEAAIRSDLEASGVERLFEQREEANSRDKVKKFLIGLGKISHIKTQADVDAYFENARRLLNEQGDIQKS